MRDPSTMDRPPFTFLMGPLFILVCVALILYGILTAQVYFYWKEFRKDPQWLKYLVHSIWGLESLHTAFCIHLLYNYLIIHFGDFDANQHIVWSAVATIFLEIVIVSGTQAFFIYRIWRLSQRSWVASIPAFALFVRIVLGFAAASLLYQDDTWYSFAKRRVTTLILNVALSFGALVDLLTTALLAYYLYNRRTRFRGSQRMLDTLMYYSLNTGALTMIVSISILFTYNLVNQSLFWAGLVEIVSKLYANSMLVMLNARRGIRATTGENDHHTIPLNVWDRNQDGEDNVATGGLRVNIFKETTTDGNTEMAGPVVIDSEVEGSPRKQPYELTP